MWRQNPPLQADEGRQRFCSGRGGGVSVASTDHPAPSPPRLSVQLLHRAPNIVPSRFFPRVALIPASVPDDGMRVEVMASGLDDLGLPDGTAPFVAHFRAEEEGEIRMVFFVAGVEVEVPIEEIERAIAFARKEVHAESYYPYPPQSDGAV